MSAMKLESEVRLRFNPAASIEIFTIFQSNGVTTYDSLKSKSGVPDALLLAAKEARLKTVIQKQGRKQFGAIKGSTNAINRCN
jgi:hypothetical protein